MAESGFTAGQASVYGVDKLGSILNNFAQTSNAIAGYRAATENNQKNIELNAEQRKLSQAFQAGNLAEALAIERKNLAGSIADKQRIAALQLAVVQDEVARQQELARGGTAAVDASIGLYGNYEDQLAAKRNEMAQVFWDSVNQSKPQVAGVNPSAIGAVADRQAAMGAVKQELANADANNLAGVRSFGQLFNESLIGQRRNNQIQDILRNFALNSQRTAQAENTFAQAPSFVAEKYAGPTSPFIAERYVNNAPPAPLRNPLGDLLKVGARGADLYFNSGRSSNSGSDPYGLSPDTYNLMPAGDFSRLGLQAPESRMIDGTMQTNGSLGLDRFATGETGLTLPRGLGIKE
ncbi:hypothetical protein UFOVP156_25 [uncultured Caudovirales phage]|uniref:Uncharacterized protein n=1 Tax=uncultured Caudovirales phage TaxID=2100421 RepID=A0A6J7WEJ6_9CAUD|nr:hypothetical protein UFOVP156_25 [uncultured Caudovirales phage]